MSASSKGAAREHKLRKILEAEGWVITRSAGSHTPVDLWALRRSLGEQYSDCLAIQVKGNMGSPYMNFRREEREELGLLAAKAGATPYLVHWPPHGECKWYPENQWPETRVAA